MNREEYDELKQNNSYMKAVDCTAPACSYWAGEHFCRLPGKLQIKNGVCMSLKSVKSPAIVNRFPRKGARYLP